MDGAGEGAEEDARGRVTRMRGTWDGVGWEWRDGRTGGGMDGWDKWYVLITRWVSIPRCTCSEAVYVLKRRAELAALLCGLAEACAL